MGYAVTGSRKDVWEGKCGWWRQGGRTRCRWPAGKGTAHVGEGPCASCDPNTKWVASAFWEEQVMTVARQYEISPWEALLLSVKLAAGRVAWVDYQLRTFTQQHDGDMDAPQIRQWLKESRNERRLLAQVAKAAVDAGVQERLVRQVELEGQVLADVLVAVLDHLQLAPDLRQSALEVAQAALFEVGETGERLVLPPPQGGPG